MNAVVHIQFSKSLGIEKSRKGRGEGRKKKRGLVVLLGVGAVGADSKEMRLWEHSEGSLAFCVNMVSLEWLA